MASLEKQKEKREFFDALYALDQLSNENDHGGDGGPGGASLGSASLVLHGEQPGQRRPPAYSDSNSWTAQQLKGSADVQPRAKRRISSPISSPVRHTKQASYLVLRSAQSECVPTKFELGDTATSELTKGGLETSKSWRVENPNTKSPKAEQQVLPSSKSRARGNKKSSTTGRPEILDDRKIFKGLTFYFVPNSDVCPLRKLRIDIAIQYGAAWAREWSESVTHVIVTNDLDSKEVAKAFPDHKIPAGALLVKDKWLVYCVGRRQREATHHKRFQVPGAEELLTDHETDGAGRFIPSHPPLSTPCFSTDSTSQAARHSTDRDSGAMALWHAHQPMDELDEITQDFRRRYDSASLPVSPKPVTASRCRPFVSSPDAEIDIASAYSSAAQGDMPLENKGFLCMERHDEGGDENPNARTIDLLQQMATHYDQVGDRWRTAAYRRAISSLKKQTRLIRTREEARLISNIGGSLAEKIEEIVATDRLRKLEYAELDPNQKALQIFMHIYGAGYVTAQRWVMQGHRNLQDLRAKADLTVSQRIGIEHYDDFLQRIPRSEVAEHGAMVRAALQAADKGLEMIIGGSYRRGKSDSGDIDILITKKYAGIEHLRTLMMETVIPDLVERGFLKIALASGKSWDQGSKWQGACVLPGANVWRRIDLLFVPWAELGAALIYFTGNDIFNRSIRLLANKKQMRLNQHRLYADVMRESGHPRGTDGRLLEGHNEKRIFEILGVPWRPPEHREC